MQGTSELDRRNTEIESRAKSMRDKLTGVVYATLPYLQFTFVSHVSCCEPLEMIVSCPAPPRTCEKEGLVFRMTFLGGVAPQSESLNQILERIIICG